MHALIVLASPTPYWCRAAGAVTSMHCCGRPSIPCTTWASRCTRGPSPPGHGYTDGADRARIERQLEGYKDQWARRLAHLEHEETIDFPGWNDWDEQGRPRSASPSSPTIPLARLLGDT